MNFFTQRSNYHIQKNVSLLLLFFLTFSSCRETVLSLEKSSSKEAMESAESEIWRRFVNEYDCLNDYTDLDGTKILPTADECRDSKPNGLAWWTPIENASMFGGLYLDGIIQRWQSTKSKEDEDKVRRIVKGLMLMASISNVPGFVGRGVSADGISHYPIGSNDQMGGWFFGLWRYLQTDLPSTDERQAIQDKMIAAARAMAKINWSIPAEAPFNARGSFLVFDHNCSRLLFVLKSMYLMTKIEAWNTMYQQFLNEKGGDTNESRIVIISKGLIYTSGKTSTWDESPSVACMRLLWELEEDPVLKEYYRQGLENSATVAMQSLSKADQYLADDPIPYDLDWRKMNLLWQPQITSTQAETVARAELDDLNKRTPKRANDVGSIREPAFAAWVVSLAPDAKILNERKPMLEKVIKNYQYDKIYEVWFFPLVATWYRINSI